MSDAVRPDGRRRDGRWRPLAIAAAVAFAIAVIGGSLTDVGPWYQSLRQPSWRPPDWLFGPAWTVIYAFVVLSAVTAWQATDQRSQREWLIGLFALNGFLNILWSLLFFRLQRPDWALIEVGVLWASILLLIVVIRRYSPRASLLLLPYLAWVAFAAALNWQVVQLNGPFG